MTLKLASQCCVTERHGDGPEWWKLLPLDVPPHDADVWALYPDYVFPERHPFIVRTVTIGIVRYRVSKFAWCWFHLLGGHRPRRLAAPTYIRYTLSDGTAVTVERMEEERALLALAGPQE